MIATETFKPLVLAQAKARKVEPRLIVVKHPVGGLNADELRERIRRRDTGVELAEHLAYLEQWEAVERDLRVDAVIPVDGKEPAQVARDVLGAAGWG